MFHARPFRWFAEPRKESDRGASKPEPFGVPQRHSFSNPHLASLIYFQCCVCIFRSKVVFLNSSGLAHLYSLVSSLKAAGLHQPIGSFPNRRRIAPENFGNRMWCRALIFVFWRVRTSGAHPSPLSRNTCVPLLDYSAFRQFRCPSMALFSSASLRLSLRVTERSSRQFSSPPR
jgi:hypothetical protein